MKLHCLNCDIRYTATGTETECDQCGSTNIEFEG